MAAGFKSATVRAADVPATQTDMPAYVDIGRISSPPLTLAEAHSIRVFADEAKTIEWAREIVSLTEMHVKVPSLTSTVEIFVDWDGVRADYAVGATYGRNAVWSDYAVVLHMQEDPSGSAPQFIDSTGNGHDGTTSGSMTSGDVITGQLGNGVDMDSNDFITISDSVILGDVFDSYVTAWTMSFWQQVQGGPGFQWQKWGSPGWLSNTVLESPYVQPRRDATQQDRIFHDGTPFAAAGWHSSVLQNGTGTAVSDFKLFANGASLAVSSAGDGLTLTDLANSGSLILNSKISGDYPAKLDEFRLSLGRTSADWITTEYNNQNAEATFWGTWTDAGGSPAQTARQGVVMMM